MQYDFAVVGLGIAGICCATSLMRRGCSIHLIDDADGHKASARAAGVINPVTGRRFAKTWHADSVLPLARKFYGEMEAELGIQLIRDRDILHALDEPFMAENWLLRKGDPEYSEFIAGSVKADDPALRGEEYAKIRGGMQVNMGNLLSSWYDRYSDAISPVRIGGIALDEICQAADADRIIFCEGVAVRKNPFFNNLPNMVAKGEALICHMPGYSRSEIVKDGVSIVPTWDDGQYWVGSTFEWENYDPGPSPEGRDYLTSKLSRAVAVDFEIVEHLSGLRPTAKDRRPYVGVHPEHSHVAMINALGAKGASLGPYCAEHLADHLLSGAELPRQMNLRRYLSS